MKMKSWYESKTLWFNGAYLLLVILGLFGYTEFQPSAEVTQIGAILAMVIPLITNMLLRLKTDSRIIK